MKCSYPGTCTNAVSTIYHASSCCVNSQDSCHFCCCKRTVVKYTYEYVRKGRWYTCHIHNSKVHVRTKTGDGYPYCYCCCEFRQPIASCLQGGLAAYTSVTRKTVRHGHRRHACNFTLLWKSTGRSENTRRSSGMLL